MKKVFLMILPILMLFMPTVVNASTNFNTSISVSSSDIKLDKEFSISINLSNLSSSGLASGQYYISYDKSKMSYLGYSVGQNKPDADYSVNDNNGNIVVLYVDNTAGENTLKNGLFATLKFKAIKEGTGSINLSGEGFATITDSIIDLSTNTASKSITITKEVVVPPAQEENKNNNNNNNTNNNNNSNNTTNKTENKKEEVKNEESKLSNDALLKKLQIEGLELNFSSDKTDYKISVPYETTKLNISYETSHDKAIVELNNKPLQVGNNEITIKVIAEDKTEKIYKITVTRNEEVPVIDLDDDNEKNDIEIEEQDNIETKENNTTKIIVCSIVIILVLALGGYALYITIKKKKDEKNNIEIEK